MARYRIIFTDDALAVVGKALEQYTSIELIHRFNEPSSGTVVAPAFPWLLEAVYTPNNRVIVIRDGEIEMAGPIEKAGPLNYDAARDGEHGTGTVTFNFGDDFATVANREIYPDPANASTAQTVARYLITAVNGETAMRNLVNLNIGPGALAGRQLAGLVLGAVAGVGTNVTKSFRFTPLGDGLRDVALSAGGLGFRIVQVDATTLEFQVYETRDLTNVVRFGRNLGNVSKVTYEIEAPTANVSIVGGADAGIDRVIRERSDAASVAAYGRREQFVDSRSAQNSTEMDQAGDDEIKNNGAKARLTIEVIETPSQQYRRDFHLGDTVSVSPFTGVEVADIVQAVTIDVDSDGVERVKPTIGTTDSFSLAGIRVQQQLLRQLAQLRTSIEIAP